MHFSRYENPCPVPSVSPLVKLGSNVTVPGIQTLGIHPHRRGSSKAVSGEHISRLPSVSDIEISLDFHLEEAETVRDTRGEGRRMTGEGPKGWGGFLFMTVFYFGSLIAKLVGECMRIGG